MNAPPIGIERLASSLQETMGDRPYTVGVLGEHRFRITPKIVITALWVMHPGATLSFRVSHAGKSLVYCPDNEIESGSVPRSYMSEKLGFFVRNADLLIHDARYSDADIASRAGEGHSSPGAAVELAEREGVRDLMLFHLDARYGASELAGIEEKARSSLANPKSLLKVRLARPGLCVEL